MKEIDKFDLKILDEAIAASQRALDDPSEDAGKAYAESIRNVTEAIEGASEGSFKSLDTEEWLIRQLQVQQKLLKSFANDPGRRYSLISVFVAYCLGKQKGYPNHSKEYMAESARLQKILEKVTGLSSGGVQA